MESRNMNEFISEMVLMGFEMEECQAAVSAGKISLEDAVDWVLKEQHKDDAPTLKLKKVVDSHFEGSIGGLLGQIPFASNLSDSEAYEGTGKLTDVITKGLSFPGIGTELTKTSLKHQIEDQARKFLLESIRKERIDQKKAHAEVLKKITQHKEEKKQKDPYTDFANLDDDGLTLGYPNVVASTQTEVESDDDACNRNECFLQIRCCDNLILKRKFASNEHLNDVWEFLNLQAVKCENMELMQIFPRRIFTEENRYDSFEQLDLLPSNCLILKPKMNLDLQLIRIEKFSDKYHSRFRRPDENKEDYSNESLYTREGGCALQIRCLNNRVLKKKFESHETLNDVWKFLESQSLATKRMELIQVFPRRVFSDDDRNSTLTDLDLLPTSCLVLKPLVDHNFPSLTGIKELSMNRNSRIRCAVESDEEKLTGNKDKRSDQPALPNPEVESDPGIVFDSHLWGDGQRLGSEANVVQHHQILAGSTAQQRVQNIITPLIAEKCNCLIWSPTVLTLQDVCIKYVVKQLLDYTSLILNLPSQVGERILQFLIKEKVLRPRHMQKFLPCHLIHLILDCYPYTTNELLHSIRHHSSLLHVSLVGCTLINDSGLQSLNNLKKLLTLNLRGCIQITDNCFSVISELQNLNSLSLEETKITDYGIIEYTKNPNLAIQVLNLNRTAITEYCLLYLHNIMNLRFLSMDWTKISSLKEFPNFEFLEGLSIQGLNIQTDELVRLRNLNRLHWLNVTDMPNVLGDDALQVLSGLPLYFLSLPSRHTTSDTGLAFILGMPLISLDLTNYVNISDIGISMLSGMKCLRRLLLSNTKLTDTGLLTLQDLHTLEILYLDRTAITDVGTVAFIGMPKLQELSLASTRVKGSFLRNGVLNRCLLLCKLNLSKTMIKIKALQNIYLPNLTLLNVDGTRLPCDPSPLLTGCPKLIHVSAKNLQSSSNLDVDSDSKL